MNPIAVALTSGGLIVIGKWSQNQSPNIDNAVGIAGIAIILSLMEQANPRISRAFGMLIIIALTMLYLPPIVKAIGYKDASKSGGVDTRRPGSLKVV